MVPQLGTSTGEEMSVYKDITWEFQSLNLSLYLSQTLSCHSLTRGAQLPPKGEALTVLYSVCFHSLNTKEMIQIYRAKHEE